MKRSETSQQKGKKHRATSRASFTSSAYLESQRRGVNQNPEDAPTSSAVDPIMAMDDKHIPTSTAIRHNTEASPYIPLTTQILLKHNLRRDSTSHDVDVDIEYNQLETTLHSLNIKISPTVHTKLNSESVGMAPMERFRASVNDLPYLDVYQGEVWAVDDIAVAYSPSQQYTYGESSIVANAGDDDEVYDQHNLVDLVVFVPRQQYNVPGMAAGCDVVVGQEIDLVGIGTQFDSYSYWDNPVSAWTMNDKPLEE